MGNTGLNNVGAIDGLGKNSLSGEVGTKAGMNGWRETEKRIGDTEYS